MIGIVNYSDSDNEHDNEEEEKEKHGGSVKRKTASDATDTATRTTKKVKLPLPSSIDKMFSEKNGEKETRHDGESHEGRSRSFEHVEGNWATYVYVPLISTENVKIIYNSLTASLRSEYSANIHFFPLKDCHISLSRTVAVRHYWIDTLFTNLKNAFESMKKFYYSLGDLKVYTNDDETRTFVSLEVSMNRHFLNAIESTDAVFREFDLQEYYKDPSLHVSFAWLLGNQKDEVENYLKKEQTTIMGDFLCGIHHNLAEKVCLKCGNRTFQIYLQTKSS